MTGKFEIAIGKPLVVTVLDKAVLLDAEPSASAFAEAFADPKEDEALAEAEAEPEAEAVNAVEVEVTVPVAVLAVPTLMSWKATPPLPPQIGWLGVW